MSMYHKFKLFLLLQGYCKIQWKQSSTTSPDPFQVGASPTTVIGSGGSAPTACAQMVYIPNLRKGAWSR